MCLFVWIIHFFLLFVSLCFCHKIVWRKVMKSFDRKISHPNFWSFIYYAPRVTSCVKNQHCLINELWIVKSSRTHVQWLWTHFNWSFIHLMASELFFTVVGKKENSAVTSLSLKMILNQKLADCNLRSEEKTGRRISPEVERHRSTVWCYCRCGTGFGDDSVGLSALKGSCSL